MAKILVVDDDAPLRQTISEWLLADGHEVHAVADPSAAMEALDEHAPDLLITDLNLGQPRTRGFEVLRKARALNPPAEVIVVTAFGSVESAVEAMREGAYDYLKKPFGSPELKGSVQRALAYHHAVAENHFLKKQLKEKYHFNQIVGRSRKMEAVLRIVERVADTDSTVLILGESGTGKELIARALHFNSRRQFAPFVPVNCAALPENLLESELFGHRKGSFTGALTDKVGLFQEANGGSIFLDEIGSMPAALQSRLLRVLQDREVRRVGDNNPVYVNVRVLAATNEPLEDKLKTGRFREDLYYRLNVIPIRLPSLRERPEDIPLLVMHYLRLKTSPRSGQPFQITRRAMAALNGYSWPGNARELENVIERACALSEGDLIRVADLPPAVQDSAPEGSRVPPGGRDETAFIVATGAATSPQSGSMGSGDPDAEPPPPPVATVPSPVGPLREFLREQELRYVNRALAYAGGDKEKAAKLLDVSLATLYRKLAEPGD
jgi:DNA-binding NtrC family response regulator